MRPSCEQLLERHARDLAPHAVEAGRARPRSGVSSMMKSTPVRFSSARMLRPSRPMMRPFMSSAGQLHDRDRRLGRVAGGEPLHADGEDDAHAPVGVALGLLLDLADQLRRVVAGLVLELLEQRCLACAAVRPAMRSSWRSSLALLAASSSALRSSVRGARDRRSRRASSAAARRAPPPCRARAPRSARARRGGRRPRPRRRPFVAGQGGRMRAVRRGGSSPSVEHGGRTSPTASSAAAITISISVSSSLSPAARSPDSVHDPFG